MKIYFSGIGGVGIGPLAQIAHYAGHEVTGSDRESSLLTENLKKQGISFDIGSQNGTFLKRSNETKPIDWFVYTAALPQNHLEIVEARNLGLKTAKRDELLSKIISDKKLKLIAIAGTHGKTSTTALTTWIFKKLNIPISYSIGSTISFGDSGFYNKDSDFFVYECDEFDRNFLHFNPFLSVITSVDYDHPDTYPTKEDYANAFKEFIEKSENTVAWEDQMPSIYLGQRNVNLLQCESDINPDITLPGEHNRKNATLVVAGLTDVGIIDKNNYANAISAVNSFPGADRRFERLLPNLYTDYGHHPIEIKATLEMAKEIAQKNNQDIVLVYQPHQNIRQHNIKKDYSDQFLNASKIYWLPTYLSREDPSLPILTPNELTENIINKENIIFAELNDELWEKLQEDLNRGALVVGMGAGSIDKWMRQKS